MENITITSTERLEDSTTINFTFNGTSYRVNKPFGLNMFTNMKINATGETANLNWTDVLSIEIAINKQNKFLK